jgi:hypothetical protein
MDARIKSAHDLRMWPARPSHRFKCQTADAIHRPCSLIGAGYAAVRIANLGSLEGSGAPADAGVCETPDGWPARPSGGTLCEGVPSLLIGTRRLPALHSGVLRLTGRAFENVDQPRLSASSWRQVLMPASGAPPSPECQRLRLPPARGAASADGGVSPLGRPGKFEGISPPRPHRCSVFTASHDDAPRRAGQETICICRRTGQQS